MPHNETNANMKAFYIKKFTFETKPIGDKNINLHISPSAIVKKPKNKEPNKAIIEFGINIKDDEEEVFLIELLAAAIFTFEAMAPEEEYDNFILQKCFPLMAEEVEKRLAAITGALGIAPLNLKLSMEVKVEESN